MASLNICYMSKPKKKFGQTTVGRLLKASVGLINPALGSLIQGNMSIEQVISSIKKNGSKVSLFVEIGTRKKNRKKNIRLKIR